MSANAHQMRTGSASASNLAAISSRLNEKQQLGYLNDRLATYIERVRQLEQENKHLQIYIKRVEESIRTKTDQEKINFEDELQRIYDTLGADNEKLFNENEKLRAENVKLKTKWEYIFHNIATIAGQNYKCVAIVQNTRTATI